jgi:hypothetical protein
MPFFWAKYLLQEVVEAVDHLDVVCRARDDDVVVGQQRRWPRREQREHPVRLQRGQQRRGDRRAEELLEPGDLTGELAVLDDRLLRVIAVILDDELDRAVADAALGVALLPEELVGLHGRLAERREHAG